MWNDNNMKTFRDYLEFYNNNDIKPFVNSIEYMRKFFREYNLDMFKDVISVPALSLKIMMNTAQKGFDIFKKSKQHQKSRKDIIIDDKIIEEKINNYKQQYKKAKRNNENYITIVDVKNLLNI